MPNAACNAHVLTPPWLAGRRPLAASRAPVTFPQTPLRLLTRIALGADPTADPSTWSWLEISERVRFDQGNGVRTVVGRRGESSVVTQSQAFLMLDNRDGALSRRNPASPYYGLLSMNTPIWVEADPGDGGHTRFQGFVNSWPKRWQDKSLNDSYVAVECSGILRRLQQNTDVKSALKRVYLSSAEPEPVAYWPCEDNEGATSIASGLAGGSPMIGEEVPHFTTGMTSSAGAVDLSQLQSSFGLIANVDLPDANGFQIEFTALANTAALTQVLRVNSGSIGDTVLALTDTLADGSPHHKAYRFQPNGGDVDIHSYTDGSFVSTTTVSSAALGSSVSIGLPSFGLSATSIAAHIAVYDSSSMNSPASRALASDAYDGELAHIRLARLCGEEGVRYTSLAATSEAMGPQPVDTFMTVLRECETADMGVLYESDWGLAYQSRTERYNQSVGLALDLSQAQIAREPEVDDDDQHVVNRWVVTRPSGSKATAEDTSGPMGSGSNGVGLWERPVTVNLAEDTQLGNQASWRLHSSTVDEDRWPRVDIALHHDPDLIGDWTGLAYGARTQVASPPDQLAPDTVDVIIEGHAEQINQFLWTASLNTSPASPYTVAVYGSADPGGTGFDHYDTSGSATTAAFVSGTDTSMSVATASGPIWTTDADDFPFDIAVSGVVLTVTAIAGASSPQTFTITQTPVNGQAKTISSGESVALARTPIYAL